MEVAISRYQEIADLVGHVPKLQIQRGRALGIRAELVAATGTSLAALAAFDQAVKVLEDLLLSEPSDSDALPSDQSLHANVLGALGTTCQRMRRLDEADSAYSEAIRIYEILLRSHPWNLRSAQALSLQFGNLGEVCSLQREPELALQWLGRSVSVMAPFVERFPGHPEARAALVRAHHKRSWYLSYLGRFGEALPDWDAICSHASVAELRDPLVVDLALGLARACSSADAFADLSPEERTAKADRFGRQAVQFLETARKEGWLRSQAQIRELSVDPRYDSFRSRPDFQELIDRLQEQPVRD